MSYLNASIHKNVYLILPACRYCLYDKSSSVFEELIKSLINGLSLRVISKPNLLRKVRFEVFRNIIIYPWIKTKPVNLNSPVLDYLYWKKCPFWHFWPTLERSMIINFVQSYEPSPANKRFEYTSPLNSSEQTHLCSENW